MEDSEREETFEELDDDELGNVSGGKKKTVEVINFCINCGQEIAEGYNGGTFCFNCFMGYPTSKY